jgi:protein gp37
MNIIETVNLFTVAAFLVYKIRQCNEKWYTHRNQKLTDKLNIMTKSITKIEWAEAVWNPNTCCNEVSAGCKFCYARKLSKNLQRMGNPRYKNGWQLTIHWDKVDEPRKWKKPTRVFVNSMSDLFHEQLPVDFIQAVFKTMNECPQHTFMILTKRAHLVEQYDREGLLNWTPNIWMGVSVEDARVTDRIDNLRATGAHTKFISAEPLIGPLPNLNLQGINWLIAGGESGSKFARPMQKEWVTDIKEQCERAGTVFFFKQWGKPGNNPDPNDPTIKHGHPQHAKGGCMLDGQVYRNIPTT